MKVKEMLDCLKRPTNVEFRNEYDVFVCLTESNYEGIMPYADRSVFKWLPACNTEDRKILVWLEDENGGAE